MTSLTKRNRSSGLGIGQAVYFFLLLRSVKSITKRMIVITVPMIAMVYIPCCKSSPKNVESMCITSPKFRRSETQKDGFSSVAVKRRREANRHRSGASPIRQAFWSATVFYHIRRILSRFCKKIFPSDPHAAKYRFSQKSQGHFLLLTLAFLYFLASFFLFSKVLPGMPSGGGLFQKPPKSVPY